MTCFYFNSSFRILEPVVAVYSRATLKNTTEYFCIVLCCYRTCVTDSLAIVDCFCHIDVCTHNCKIKFVAFSLSTFQNENLVTYVSNIFNTTFNIVFFISN